MAMSLGNLGNVAFEQGDCKQAWALAEESLAISRELGDKRYIAIQLSNLSEMDCDQGNYKGAHRFAQEGLELAGESGGKLEAVVCLGNLGTVLGAMRIDERAVHLLAAAATLYQALGATTSPSSQRRIDKALQDARTVLGEEAYSAAWERGRDMTLEDAIRYALSVNCEE